MAHVTSRRTRAAGGEGPVKRVIGKRSSTAVPLESQETGGGGGFIDSVPPVASKEGKAHDKAGQLTRKAKGPPSPGSKQPAKRTRKNAKGGQPPSPRLLRPIGHMSREHAGPSSRAVSGMNTKLRSARYQQGALAPAHGSNDENSAPYSAYSAAAWKEKREPARQGGKLGKAAAAATTTTRRGRTALTGLPKTKRPLGANHSNNSSNSSVSERSNTIAKLRQENADLKLALDAERQNTHSFIKQNQDNLAQIQELTKKLQVAQRESQGAQKESKDHRSVVSANNKKLDAVRTELAKQKKEVEQQLACNKEMREKLEKADELTRRSVEKLQKQYDEALSEQTRLRSELDKADGSSKQQKSQISLLKKQKAEKESLLKTAQQEKAESDALLERMQKQKTEQDSMIKQIQDDRAEKQNRIQALEQKSREELLLRKKLHNLVQELKGNIRVYCRVRPPLRNEWPTGATEPAATWLPTKFPDGPDQRLLALTGEEVTRLDGTARGNKVHSFEFDRCFRPEEKQGDVFEEISQLVQSAVDGYKVSIFAYGQTGSGKTYTMEGEPGVNEGMIPRAVSHLFAVTEHMKSLGWKFEFSASFLEIYNEQIRDLLETGDSEERPSSPRSPTSFSNSASFSAVVPSSSSSASLQFSGSGAQLASSSSSSNLRKALLPGQIKLVKTSYGLCTEVSGIQEVPVIDAEGLLSLVRQAAKNRATGSTKLNERSSRSHSVFRLRILGNNMETDHKTYGTLNMIDLAGSERIKKSGAEGDVAKEAVCINKSLSALGDVIVALANKERHVPYRNSKLTHLLQDSFGADNSKTLMFVNISPAPIHISETLCSLRFASKVHIAPQASLDLLCNPDWTDAEVYAQSFSQLLPSHRPHCRINKVTPGHCTPRHNRWCHIHSLIEPDWSDNSATHRTFICGYDPFEPPFDVFDSWNSYADFVNADATLSPDICSHADTSNTDV
eukprot:g53820.t1